MEAIKTAADFSAIFTHRQSRFIIDLSKSNLLDVLTAYQDHKRRTSPGYTITATMSSIRAIQDSCLQVLQPDDVTDEFYACFVQWALHKGLAYSTIKAYCAVHSGNAI